MSIRAGLRTFNFALKVPAAAAAAVEEIIGAHAAFMKEHHSLDDSGIHLHHYYVAKADELDNPLDPAAGTTGFVLYSINEVYMAAEGIGQHMEKAAAWAAFDRFLGMLGEFGQVVVINGEVVRTL
jgi:hypothetical protein